MADLDYQPRSVMDCVVASARPSQASKFVTHQQAMLAEAQDAMAAAQQHWHAAYDQNRRHVWFNVGESVLLNTKGLDLAHLDTDGKRNFASRFIGPNKILQSTGPDTCKLALPPGLRLHPEYHSSRLRPYTHDDDPTRTTRVQPVLTADGTEGHLVDSIIQHRRRKGVLQFKVKWLITSFGSSWEPVTNLRQVTELVRLSSCHTCNGPSKGGSVTEIASLAALQSSVASPATVQHSGPVTVHSSMVDSRFSLTVFRRSALFRLCVPRPTNSVIQQSPRRSKSNLERSSTDCGGTSRWTATREGSAER
ncbi:hypothetical protein PC117_g14697 [Phytophthora cactorum]|uniref:Chromo domain-containing protein n=1 Tax=Phytophthora cactorum TaxID=29920 RepID=A0A8T1CUJ4_9STRA|nr:hypothetical protein PC117_g14697 [Phytophthora cactorum]